MRLEAVERLGIGLQNLPGLDIGDPALVRPAMVWTLFVWKWAAIRSRREARGEKPESRRA